MRTKLTKKVKYIIIVLLMLFIYFCMLSSYSISFENGKIRSIGKIEKFQRTGVWRFYWENGKIKSIGSIFKGKPNGKWRFFNKNGQLTIEGDFENGRRINTWTYHYGEGKYIEKGKLCGDERTFLVEDAGLSVFDLTDKAEIDNIRDDGMIFGLFLSSNGTIAQISYCKDNRPVITKIMSDTGVLLRELIYTKNGKKKELLYDTNGRIVKSQIIEN